MLHVSLPVVPETRAEYTELQDTERQTEHELQLQLFRSQYQIRPIADTWELRKD
jgi:hypothetical protein